MKDDKFCVSKTVAFLVSLIVIVGGIFYVMNYANTQKKTTGTEAANDFGCKAAGGRLYRSSVISACSDLNAKADKSIYNVTYTEVTTVGTAGVINREWDNMEFRCCREVKATAKQLNCRDKAVGGTNWYKVASVQAFKNSYGVKYLFDVEDKTPLVGAFYKAQNPDRLCLKVGRMTLRQTCSQVGGTVSTAACASGTSDYPQSEDLSGYRASNWHCCVSP